MFIMDCSVYCITISPEIAHIFCSVCCTLEQEIHTFNFMQSTWRKVSLLISIVCVFTKFDYMYL